MSYRSAEWPAINVSVPDGDPRHCVVCHKRYHDSAAARAIQNGLRVLTGDSAFDRARAAVAARAICVAMRRLGRREE